MTISWPKAVLCLDGDAFFASVTQAVHPELKGKPVVTGWERGIATAVSYEARALGVTRGMRCWEIKKTIPYRHNNCFGLSNLPPFLRKNVYCNEEVFSLR